MYSSQNTGGNNGWAWGNNNNNDQEQQQQQRGRHVHPPMGCGKFVMDKLKTTGQWLIKDGIGDSLDRWNFWTTPLITVFAFSVLGLTKLAGHSFKATECLTAAHYGVGKELMEAGTQHCLTASRYYIRPGETLPLPPDTMAQRFVRNPDWVILFWGPILFFLYVLPRLLWSMLVENQGIDFANLITKARAVNQVQDGVTRVCEANLKMGLSALADDFKTARSSKAYRFFLFFQFYLVVAPLLLLLLVLPWIIGGNFRTYGLDVVMAKRRSREWHDNPLPAFPSGRLLIPPLIPRTTYCDFTYMNLPYHQRLMYRCWLDSHWHEWTALVTWFMMVFLFIINLVNFMFWLRWTQRMWSSWQRSAWIVKYWMNVDANDLTGKQVDDLHQFTTNFNTAQLLFLYFIECHTSRVVAKAICSAIFQAKLDHSQGKPKMGNLHELGGKNIGMDIERADWNPSQATASTVNEVEDDW